MTHLVAQQLYGLANLERVATGARVETSESIMVRAWHDTETIIFTASTTEPLRLTSEAARHLAACLAKLADEVDGVEEEK